MNPCIVLAANHAQNADNSVAEAANPTGELKRSCVGVLRRRAIRHVHLGLTKKSSATAGESEGEHESVLDLYES